MKTYRLARMPLHGGFLGAVYAEQILSATFSVAARDVMLRSLSGLIRRCRGVHGLQRPAAGVRRCRPVARRGGRHTVGANQPVPHLQQHCLARRAAGRFPAAACLIMLQVPSLHGMSLHTSFCSQLVRLSPALGSAAMLPLLCCGASVSK
jgi:hypothetical protein